MASRRSYFTNGKATKSNDPFAILGLEWGGAASSADIKAAFRRQAQLLHPDVNKDDTPDQAIKKFQKLQTAYETLMKSVTGEDNLDLEEWRIAIWRQSDRIALDRDDVAGTKRKRPIQPVSTKMYGRELGHPGGRGNRVKGEYLGDGGKRASSVGTGRSKWVQPKEFKPWNPQEHNFVKASDLMGKGK